MSSFSERKLMRRGRSRFAAVAVAGVAAVLLAPLSTAYAAPASQRSATPVGSAVPVGSAIAAPGAPVAPAGQLTDDCANLREQSRLKGAAAVRAVCVRPTTVRTETRGGGVAPSVVATPSVSPIYAPDACFSRTDGSVALNRFEWCQVRGYVVTLTQFQNGTMAVIGTVTYQEISYAAVSAFSNAWFQQIGFDVLAVTGDSAGIRYDNTDAGCYWGTCTRGEWNFPGRHALSTSPRMGTVNVRMDLGFGAAAAAQTFMSYRWSHDDPTVRPSSTAIVVTPQVRCDNGSAGLNGFGCIQPTFTPSFELNLADPAVDQAAHHIYEAQASGLGGADPRSSMPNRSPLHRLTDDYLSQQNTNRACPASYVRPSGFQCDEYPFKSSWEGAATQNPGGPARTNPGWCNIPEPAGSGPFGYSVCMIPGTQNASAGGKLGNFYLTNRVMSGDAFYVWIRCC
jgi:hypothetical protein